MIYPIVAYGDPVLREKARDIEKDELDLKQLAEDMFETMYSAHGVGLACPQIGRALRMFVVDGEPMDESMSDFKRVFVNPQILETHGEAWAFEEGCLSIPGIREEVNREPVIKLRYCDVDFNQHEEVFDGLRARIVQHEYDHIEGILFTDHLTNFKKRILKGKLASISKGKVDVDYNMRFPIRARN
ncbi:MAG: peptide deformylase [Cyclobacteriaceae bacterium]|nr:MAG: peptide deformylase [Cyclobacteriaceae bacterium]